MNILKKMGWPIAILMIIFQLLSINVFNREASLEIKKLTYENESDGYVYYDDLKYFEKTKEIIERVYPQIIYTGWAMYLEKGNPTVVKYLSPSGKSLQGNFVFDENGFITVEGLEGLEYKADVFQDMEAKEPSN